MIFQNAAFFILPPLRPCGYVKEYVIMPLNRYQVFLKVAEYSNLSKVAEELGYTQSAISHLIHKLEDDLGVSLIRRTKTGIMLSDAGWDLLEHMRSVVNAEEKLYQTAADIRGFKKGILKVGCFSSISMRWIPSVAKHISENYPNIVFVQNYGTYDVIAQKLRDGSIDVGFLTARTSGDFDFLPLYEDEYVVIMPKNHPLAKYERIPLQALTDEKFIYVLEGCDDEIKGLLNSINGARIAHYVNEDMLAFPLVEHGLGIAILPKLVTENISHNAEIRSFEIPRARTIGLVAPSFKNAPPLVKLFVGEVRAFLAEERTENNA